MKAMKTGAMQLPLCLSLLAGTALPAVVAGAAVTGSDVVTLVELPPLEDAGPNGASNIAADGTVVGFAFGSGVVRWRPGQAPERLGGDIDTLENILPLISADGSVIVAANYFANPDPKGPLIPKPGLWRGGTTWEPAGGIMLAASTPYGISDNGTYLVGSGVYTLMPPDDEAPIDKAWIWSAAFGQIVLGDLPDLTNTHAWGVSNDGSVAVGYATNQAPDHIVRYGVIWNADGAASLLRDAQQRSLGQAVACSSDCSVVVGAGTPRPDASNQAWRWTAQGGVEYLGEAPNAQAGAIYYAQDTSDDGSVVIGSWVEFDPNTGSSAHGFVWTAQGGVVGIVDFLAAHGIDYGTGFNDIVVASMTRDGRRLLLNGTDADFQRIRAVVKIDPDAIFANGFD